MASFPSTATSVFQGMAAPLWASIHSLPRPLPKFKLVPKSRPRKVAAELAPVVDSEIIPRLVLAHPIAAAIKAASARSPGSTSPEAFARVVLERDADLAGAVIADATRDGAEPLSLYDDLLAPTAVLLADSWRDDRLSHTEVTIGLARLLRLVRGLAVETAYNGENDDAARSALFAPCPGEQQTFGFYMLEERFRWGGWRTWVETTATCEDLVANVRGQWFDMVCLSVSRADNIAELSGLTRAIRRASRNTNVLITVDGAPFVEHPDRVTFVGADSVAACDGDDRLGTTNGSRRVATA
jgi:methanogenic corrinoid protein MtbC1